MPKLPILFDLDGTITNPALGFFASVGYALDQLEVECPSNESLEQYIGPPLRESFGTIIGTDDAKLIEKAVELYRWRLDNGGKFAPHPTQGPQAA